MTYGGYSRILCCMWHRFVRWVGRRSLRWFYRRVVIVGAELIPESGPLLLIANHPNDLPDVLMGYLSTLRDVHFIATISAATNPLARATYRGLGVIPVTRIRDVRKLLQQGAAIADVNRLAYRRVVDAFRRGLLIGVFPEGGVTIEPGIAPLRPGVAQMVLQCFDDGACDSLTVVPLGIQYEARDQPGTDCCIVAGKPLIISRAEVDAEDRRGAFLTARFTDALERVTRPVPFEGTRTSLENLAATIGASLAEHPDDGLPFASRVAPFLNGLDHTSNDAMERTHELALTVEALGGRANSALDHARLRQIAARQPERAHLLADGNKWKLLALFPLATLGWLTHGVLFAFIWRMALRTAESPAHRVARAYLPGIYIVLSWYLVLSAVAAVVLSLSGITPLYSLLLFMLLFRLGDTAVKWRHGLNARRFRTRAKKLGATRLAQVDSAYNRIRHWWEESGRADSVHATESVQALV